MADTSKVVKQFLGDDKFPVKWDSEAEKQLFWVYDDLHCPHPLSPMYFDIGGWWLTCDHMFRRFGTPFAADWIAKTTFEDLAMTPTNKSLVWEFVDTTAISSTYYPTFRFTVPGVCFEPKTQGVDGPKELTTDWNWVWRYDGTNMPKVEYMTADSTIL